jgi:hypothetical protein
VRPSELAGLLAHREYAPAVMRGHTNEQRKALDAASAAALHCEEGGAEPPRDAVRVVDNVRTTRPELLLHSRDTGQFSCFGPCSCFIAFVLDIPNGFWPLNRAVGRAYIRETVPARARAA